MKHNRPYTSQSLIPAIARTGAKFTPANHRITGDHNLDSILRGDHIATNLKSVLNEFAELRALGIDMIHEHPRNPSTREQSCDEDLARRLGRIFRQVFPDGILSFGASRNGKEISRAIAHGREWSRLAHAGHRLSEGGADLVTIQAAAELKIIQDLVSQKIIRFDEDHPELFELLQRWENYRPDDNVQNLSIDAHATEGGKNYGRSSARIQYDAYCRAIAARAELRLPIEVEWTQLAPSYILTKLAMEHFPDSLGSTRRLNVTILFGFSPRLPFPLTYGEFRQAVELALSLQNSHRSPGVRITVSVGAAVLPRQAASLTVPLDVGPNAGKMVGPLERIIAYACVPGSGVDVMRFGLEDAPFLLGPQQEILPATNVDIAKFGLAKIAEHGGVLVTDRARLNAFKRSGADE